MEEVRFTSVAFSPDGTILATARDNNRIELWDAATRTDTELEVITRESIAILGEYERNLDVRSVAFSPDGTLIAAAYSDNTVKLWDVATRESLSPPWKDIRMRLRPWRFRLMERGWLPRQGITRSSCGDVATRESIATLEGHTDEVTSVAFSPDGTRLASTSRDRTVKLWDVATRESIATLEGHRGGVTSVAFSPAGTLLASGGGAFDDAILLWDVAEWWTGTVQPPSANADKNLRR